MHRYKELMSREWPELMNSLARLKSKNQGLERWLSSYKCITVPLEESALVPSSQRAVHKIWELHSQSSPTPSADICGLL